ncbi:hypothetical protein Gpo141_00014296, partial [Globisporangium polare]
KKVTLSQLWRLLYRLIVLVAAVGYVAISFIAVTDTKGLLREQIGPYFSTGRFVSKALEYQIGTTTLRESPLVTGFLKNDTSPRNGTIYLESTGPSFQVCEEMTASARAIYADENLRTLYAAIARDTAYNLTFVAANITELIVPVVTCDVHFVVSGFESIGVFNFLVRKIAEPDNVYIMSVNLANQIYKINLQKEIGPAAAVTLTFVNDLHPSNKVECYFIVALGYPYEEFNFRVYLLTSLSDRGSWIFTGIPNGDPTDLSKIVRVSTRSGFYIQTDTTQANIFTERWLVSTNPIEAVLSPEWISRPYMYDTWAWVHYIQLLFGVDLLASLVILVTVSYRNVLAGKLWIGDGFVAVSSRTTLRGIIVLASWYFGEFWSLLEFCVYTANETVEMTHMAIYTSIIYADLLTIYFSICGLLGYIFRERIDPIVAMISFHVGFTYRVAIIGWFSSIHETVGTFSSDFYLRGMQKRIEGQTKVSPMQFWVPHNVFPVPSNLIASVLMPIFSTLVFVLLYIAVKKIYRHLYPDPLHIVKLTGNTAISEDEANMRQRLSVLTIFEIATGAQLANRFGLVCEYDNCLFIKGMKFATPDGIYSSGFVIASQKYLIQANDVWTILLMKLIRLRYTNIYMYEVNGSTVEQKARLVYPDTFTLLDLVNLNTNILS